MKLQTQKYYALQVNWCLQALTRTFYGEILFCSVLRDTLKEN